MDFKKGILSLFAITGLALMVNAQTKKPTLQRAQPAAQPEQPRRNFFERIFNPNPKPN